MATPEITVVQMGMPGPAGSGVSATDWTTLTGRVTTLENTISGGKVTVTATDAAALAVKNAGATNVFLVDTSTPEVGVRNAAALKVYSAAGAEKFSVAGASGNTVVAGTLSVGGVAVTPNNPRFLLTLGPWYFTDIQANTTDVTGVMTIPSSAGTFAQVANLWVAPTSGSVVGLAVTLNATRSTGGLTFYPRINGTQSTTVSVAISNTAPRRNTTLVTAANGSTFTAGQTLEVSLNGGSTWTPTTADAAVWLYVLMDAV